MTHALPNLRLYLANRTWSVLTPIYILAIMTGITVVITAIIGIATGLPIPDDIRHDMRFNGGAIYCIPGFLISVGALAMNRNFSMALALGSTRRHFWIGTALGFVITSLTLGVGSLVGLGLERLTNHWFIGARAFDVTPLGMGTSCRPSRRPRSSRCSRSSSGPSSAPSSERSGRSGRRSRPSGWACSSPVRRPSSSRRGPRSSP